MSMIAQTPSPSTPALEPPPCDCPGCRGDELESHPSEWGPETDEFVWELTPEFRTLEQHDAGQGDELDDDHLHNAAASPAEASESDWADYYATKAEYSAREHLDASERMTMAEVVARQVAFYRSWSNPVGEMLADCLDELHRLVWVTGASSPAEHFARIDALDRQFS